MLSRVVNVFSPALFGVLVAGQALGQPGTFDSSFGQDGRARFTLDQFQSGALSVEPLPNGQTLVGGQAGEDVAVLRLDAFGRLDPSYGSGGVARVRALGVNPTAADLAVLPGGAVLVAAVESSPSVLYDFGGRGSLVRLTPTGALDATFGVGGAASLGDGFSDTQFTRVKVLPDGKILAVGSAVPAGASFSRSDAFVARFSAGGQLDPSFGANGLARVSQPEGGAVATGLRQHPDGRLLMAGYRGSGSVREPFVAAFGADGAPDGGFGDGGVQTLSFGTSSFEVAMNLVVDQAGRIVVIGFSGLSPVLVLARLAPDGVLDSSFGTGGLIEQVFGRTAALGFDLALQDDGKLVVAAAVAEAGGSQNLDVFAARFTSNGELDASWGTGGFTSVDFEGDDLGAAIALQADGKIVVAGYQRNPNTFYPREILVIRLLNDGLPAAAVPMPVLDALSVTAPAPNPVATTAHLVLDLRAPSTVRVDVFDAIGRPVAVLLNGPLAVGRHVVAIDAQGLAPGPYLARVTADGVTSTRTLTVVR